MSEPANQLYSKLFALQADLKPIVKSADNPFFKSRYFDINALLAELRPLLQKNGLLLAQPLQTRDGRLGIATIVAQPESNQALESWSVLPPLEDPQKIGAAITYFRRYALVSLFALEADDDDGESLASRTPPSEAQPPTRHICITCGNEFSPKPGTEAFAKQCFDCYLASKKKD